jgi:hypothetical protein
LVAGGSRGNKEVAGRTNLVAGGSSSFIILFYCVFIINMYRMVLTRQQREKLVLDLYNQGKNTREIAQEVRMSFRDISAIVDKARKDEEKRRSEKMSQSSQAYNSSSSPTTIKLIDGYSSY